MEKSVILKSEEDTLILAQQIASTLKRGSVITLNGNLGAGKTIFAKGIAIGLHISQVVTSPTFNILKCYFDGTIPFYHIDAYRLEDRSSTKNIGLEEVIEGDGICVIEWPIFIKNLILSPLNVKIEIIDTNTRKFIFSSNDKKYEEVFAFLERIY